jgi:glycosyltransferase involved in cell wall biosynthesis
LPETITACLITKDEEERLPAALASVAFCDQIVVVDSGSTDRTREIAREAGALVIENPWPGYAAQRNVALGHATSDWVLEIDADESLTPELQEEIKGFLGDPPPGYDICVLPQFHRFLGAELRSSVKYPGYRSRMFRRGAYRHDESVSVHEGIWPAGPTWPFEHDMSHELAGSWREALRDMANYTRLEASHHPPPDSARALAIGVTLRPAGKFWYRVIVDGGWRDGWRGVTRIALECVSDVWIWIRRARGGGRATETPGGPAAHFGAMRAPGLGNPLVTGVASGANAAERAARRLEEIRSEGIDVALVSDASPPGASFRVRRLPHFGVLELARGLDAESQVRGRCDAMLVEGRRAAALMRVMPSSRKGHQDPVAKGESPAALKRRLEGAAETTPE